MGLFEELKIEDLINDARKTYFEFGFYFGLIAGINSEVYNKIKSDMKKKKNFYQLNDFIEFSEKNNEKILKSVWEWRLNP